MQIEIRDLSKAYNGQIALDKLSLNLQDVGSLAIVGPSGGGKTTLLRVLGGLETPDSGTVVLNGRPVDFQEQQLMAHRKRIAMVFQAYNLFPHLTALQNITLPLVKTRAVPAELAQQEAVSLLERFGLAEHLHKHPNQLSGGQKQRVAIARALALKPEVLLFDEPTSALDPEITAEILDVFNDLRVDNKDLILVTHEIGFARHACDYVAFVSEGRVEMHGRSDMVYDQPESEAFRRFVSRIISWKAT
ncbi:MAG: amino acid ABC transporter ATP-binding protein [Ruminococcaceae bacterium]|nr:amino acid ABC transporter ATP-binding protein [Oscillospiraceae bacterium]